jgi:hypothetical protein
MNPLSCSSPLDRWARRGALLALLSLAATLLWLGLSLYHPARAEAEAKGAISLTGSNVDLGSPRSTR